MQKRYALAWTSLWLVLFLISLEARPLLPVDETRYAAVAWEMWLRDSFFVPYLNGEGYSHKPPLLFWMIQLGWSLFGVHTWVARLIPPLFGLGALFLTTSIARRLWPDDANAHPKAPLVVLGSLGWAVLATVLMFDTLIAFFSLLGMLGILHSYRQSGHGGWLLLGLSIGLGVLAKGPVILIYTLPVALLAPWWIGDQRPVTWKGWYLGILSSFGLGAAIALSWALPAAWLGGEKYRNAILWGQTAGRMVESFAHRHPWWWYLPLLPVVLFPWFLWLPFWRGLIRTRLDGGLRFCLIWSLSGLLVLSLISGKQIHYLLPLIPPFALLAIRVMAGTASQRLDPWLPAALFMAVGVVLIAASLLEALHDLPDWVGETSPLWGIALLGGGWLLGKYWLRTAERSLEKLALASIALVAVLNVGVLREAKGYYDITPTSRYLATLQAQDIPIAHLGKYHGQFQFAGRLEKPIPALSHEQVLDWAAQHPTGRIILYQRSNNAQRIAQAEFHQPYRGRQLLIWSSQALLANPALLGEPEESS